ncbi:MAG: CDP-alcohol phosphatidyltransferase family protein [Candidatus Nezhaarchaeota archaeon]|nr:CDP-alcohol phosphatidyltransferase family protein [Candidatus Nezhaarchaeota archaeon]
MISLLGKLRRRYEELVDPIGRSLGKIGVSPNSITVTSALMGGLAGLLFYLKEPLLGVVAIILVGITDMLDGAVARATHRVTKFGGVLDHVLDRYSEFAILLGMSLGGYISSSLAVYTLFGMVMASYTRAKAESLGGLKSCSVGLMERQEKFVLLIVGGLLVAWFEEALNVAAAVCGTLSHITVGQRLLYTYRQTRGG